MKCFQLQNLLKAVLILLWSFSYSPVFLNKSFDALLASSSSHFSSPFRSSLMIVLRHITYNGGGTRPPKKHIFPANVWCRCIFTVEVKRKKNHPPLLLTVKCTFGTIEKEKNFVDNNISIEINSTVCSCRTWHWKGDFKTQNVFRIVILRSFSSRLEYGPKATH